MAQQQKTNHGLFLVVVALAGWVVPGAGHLLVKEYKRAAIIFVTIAATFLVGLYVGSIGVIDSQAGRIWYYGQIMTTPAVGIIANITANTLDENDNKVYVSYGQPASIGQIYTTIAGLLNLLCVISAVYMAHSGRGEVIGEEEDAG